MKKNYYVTTSGELKRKDNTIQLETKDGEKKKIPVKNCNSLHLMGQLDFNTRFFEFLGKQETLAHYYGWYGDYRGSFYPKEFLNSGMVLANQAKHYNDSKKRLKLAQKFVEGASYNMLQNLRYYRNKGKDVEDQISEIEKLRESIEDVDTAENILGVEGSIRRTYYSTFQEILRDSFTFSERVKQPPDNEVNAMISFGNSMLYSSILNEVYRTQLNPTISYLHEPRERRFSLNLDISEIFKPIIVDKTIFKLVNKQELKPDKHFDKDLDGCLLNDKGRKKFISEYEERLENTAHNEKLGRKVSYQRMLRLEAYKIIKHVVGDKEYRPWRAD